MRYVAADALSPPRPLIRYRARELNLAGRGKGAHVFYSTEASGTRGPCEATCSTDNVKTAGHSRNSAFDAEEAAISSEKLIAIRRGQHELIRAERISRSIYWRDTVCRCHGDSSHVCGLTLACNSAD